MTDRIALAPDDARHGVAQQTIPAIAALPRRARPKLRTTCPECGAALAYIDTGYGYGWTCEPCAIVYPRGELVLPGPATP